MNRPYVICHMVVSLDGKVTGDFLYTPECEKGTEIYYEVNRNFSADAFACGRITMEGSFTHHFKPDLTPYENVEVPAGDYIADPKANFFAVAFDRHGTLGWKTSKIADEDPGYDGAHIIEVMLETADKRYLAYLRHIGVSYILAGKNEMDLNLAMEKLSALFGIQKLLLEGGSVINGAFLNADIIDELSLVYVPLVAGNESLPLFHESVLKKYTMRGSAIKDGTVWVRMEADRSIPEEEA